MTEISLVEKIHLADVATHMFRLYALDAVWTEAAERPVGVPAESLPALRELVRAIDGVLVDVPGHAQTLESAFARHEKEVEAAYDRLMADEQLASKHKQRWRLMVEKAGGISALTVKSMRTMASLASDERVVLTEKLKQIEASDKAEGDVNSGIVCGGLVGGAIAFALTGVAWPAALATAAAAGAYCGANDVFG